METTVRKQKKNLETKKPSIYSLQLHEMQDWLKEQGEPKFRAGQILIGYIKTCKIMRICQTFLKDCVINCRIPLILLL